VSIQRKLSVALLVGGGLLGSGLVGCKSPMGGLAFWNKDDSSIASSSPDTGSQKYEGLAKEFGAKPGSTTGMGGTPQAAEEGFFASSWNKTTAAVSSAFTMKPKTETNDPTSLSSKPGKVGAAPFVAAGRLLENQNKLVEAQQKYEQALKAEPNDLTAMVSLARLHDRQGNGPQAVELYQRAIKAYPKTALVHNDLGLCYARQQQWARATESLNSAIALQPANPKYRNNMATVMVEMGRPDDALKQLTSVNPPAVAHYNLAYLLQQKGQNELAVAHLQQAIATDASLGPAHEMLAQLTGGAAAQTADNRLQAQPVSTPLYGPRTAEGPALSEPAPRTSSNAGPYSGGNTYSVSDDIGPIQPSEVMQPQTQAPAYGSTTNWGSSTEAAPAPVAGIEPLPPIE
jgi:tetratricopeptide (TPR) repeat protein